ncbi:MAG: hypothetical protein ACRDD2_02235 [Sarcina sp.]
MAVYKPMPVVVTSAAINAANGAAIIQEVGTTVWNLVLIYGTAIATTVSGTTVVLKSGTILGWYSNVAQNVSTATLRTFSDAEGRFGITVSTGKKVTFKFYSHG